MGSGNKEKNHAMALKIGVRKSRLMLGKIKLKLEEGNFNPKPPPKPLLP
ncbi:MAG: hypothetical protein M1414_06105 [Candidatus Thermoplasmatota archaeon]|nr:hypothetical protein [Candidatus Thermoplasmatota archaeon]